MASIYNFAILDPRPTTTAKAANDLIFENSIGVFGIEVTVPALAARCGLGNLYPQHSGGDEAEAEAAIEEAYWLLAGGNKPPAGATLATVRADLDSVGTMAIFNLRVRGESLESAMERIALVAQADRFARGGWSGPRPLPTRDNPWDESSATAESSRPLAAIGAAVMDFKATMADRVSTMEQWLLTGDEPAQYRTAVEAERLDMITALEGGAIKHEVRADGRIAVVESTHRAATNVGYSLAPVVVALNPEFRFQGGPAHRKFTIAQFEAGYLDLRSAFAELNELDGAVTPENRWDGTPTVGGSPQGVSSTSTTNQVVEVVSRHLLK